MAATYASLSVTLTLVAQVVATTLADMNPLSQHAMAPGYRQASLTLAGVYNVLTLIGLMGNAVSTLIFGHPKMRRSSINILLASMSISDFLLLLFAEPVMGVVPMLHTLNHSNADAFEACVVVSMYPLTLVMQATSTWLLVLITVERFLAVCYPLAARRICTTVKAKISVTCVLLCAVGYSFPRFMEYNLTRDDEGQLVAGYNLMANEKYLLVYVSVLYYIFMFLIPFLVLVIMNTYVIYSLRKARVARGSMTAQQLTEHRTTRMMIVVIVMFLACNLFPTIINFAQTIRPGIFQEDTNVKDLMMIVIDASNLVFILNCTLNPFVYHCLSDRYRKIFTDISHCNYSKRTSSFTSMTVGQKTLRSLRTVNSQADLDLKDNREHVSLILANGVNGRTENGASDNELKPTYC